MSDDVVVGVSAPQGVSPFSSFMEDILRLGLEGAEGYTNRSVERIQLTYVTNPYGRQPPHLVVTPDGSITRLTPFQTVAIGYAPDVLAVEVLGVAGQSVNQQQASILSAFGAEIRRLHKGRLSFCGDEALVVIASGSQVSSENTANALPFMAHDQLVLSQSDPHSMRSKMNMVMQQVQAAPLVASQVQQIFDILGTPSERRQPLPPGSLFNSMGGTRLPSASAQIFSADGQLFKAPNVRDITKLVIVPSHDPFKSEPTEESAYTIDTLRKADQRLGMSDFRGHYLLAKDGVLHPARSLEQSGNCWPGKNDGAIQVVIAGNGKNPTEAQRQTLFEYATAMRRHYERPLQAAVREVVFAEQILGIDPNGFMQQALANASLVTADVGAKAASRARTG